MHRLRPRVAPLERFLRAFSTSARFVLIVDTHSDITTGSLVYARAPGNENYVAPAGEVSTDTISIIVAHVGHCETRSYRVSSPRR